METHHQEKLPSIRPKSTNSEGKTNNVVKFRIKSAPGVLLGLISLFHFQITGEGTRVSPNLFAKYLREKEALNNHLQNLKNAVATKEKELSESINRKKVVATEIELAQEKVQSLAKELEKAEPTIEFLEENLAKKLKTMKEENEIIQKEKMEVEHLLTKASNEMSQVESRTKNFEFRLGAASKEIATILEGTKQAETDVLTKKEIYEKEIQRVTDEISDISKEINITNAESVVLVEAQTALENQLSVVKNQVMNSYILKSDDDSWCPTTEAT